MVVSFLYVILALLGLTFLIFIHELGHYFMARRAGMRVEVFSIGFGRAIFSWLHDGVKWQIGWLPFGGYVRIAGSDLDQTADPYTVSDGFFGKPPLARIKVALMGPIVNLLFAILAFTVLWTIGGREKHFAEYTKKIGWVDPSSELYALGVRPGDEIIAYDRQEYQGAKDHLYAPMTAESKKITVQGYHVDYAAKEKVPFSYETRVYSNPEALDKDILTSGILAPASYIIYDHLPGGGENPLPEGSPLRDSGIVYGDRIVWVNGELVFSVPELNYLLSGQTVLLTIERGNQTILARVPRVELQELRLGTFFKEELADWQFEAQLQGSKFQNIYSIPYSLNDHCVIEERIPFIDKDKEDIEFPQKQYSSLEQPLQPGDRVVAVNGTPVAFGYQFLQQLQTFRVNVIVERNSSAIKAVPATDADTSYDASMDWSDLQQIANSLGTPEAITQKGHYVLLRPITPKAYSALSFSPEKQERWTKDLMEKKKALESIEDPEKRARALHFLDQQQRRLMLGFAIQDETVYYNPSPFKLWKNVFQEIWRTLTALFTGTLNPKWLAGPIGIVQIVHDTSMSSLKEALYWLGAISLNLGILNLLPIPMLDGGTVLMTLFEVITRRKLHPKTLEKLILPFTFLLLGFFVYLTYHDLLRLFGNLLNV